MSIAYSYLRFSSPEQAKGDSIRRQTEATAEWCKRHKVTLDTKLRMTDSGVSAFKGKHRRSENADTNALAGFLRAVERGKVAPGSYLILESLDRLTREDIIPAVNLFTSILLRGVRIVQLHPSEHIYTDKDDMTAVMLALVELSRGNSESKMKSERVGKAWAHKLKNANKKVVTKRTPTWITCVDGKLVLDEAKTAVVRRMFALCVCGYSTIAIAKLLNEEGVPVLGRTTMKGRPCPWGTPTVRHILTSRAAICQFIPYATDGKKTPGEPVSNYFPRAVDDDTFYRAQAALKTRAAVGRGRRGKHINLFAGLLTDARSGGPMTYCHRNGSCRIEPNGAIHGAKIQWTSFPAAPFEFAVLSLLREVTAAELEEGDECQKLAAHEARVDQLDDAIAKWEAKMDAPDLVEMVTKNMPKLKRERDEEVAKRDAARRAAANPASEALEEVKTLADVLARDNSDDQRLKVRAALRQCLLRVGCIFRPGRGPAGQLAEIIVWFAGLSGGHRTYIILTSPDGVRAKSIAAKHAVDDPDNPQWPYIRERVKWLESVDLGELRSKLPLLAGVPKSKPKKPK